ncbi:hypothetical protein [Aeromicrobium sp. CTD01-1L150]|uniref:hypothetical protein n=1 Tax=Aeromicrobium sp. CTD01-1L150 TaxID=3341830 RepID=UPI0035BF319C
MWFPLLVASVGGALMGLRLTRSISPTMAANTSKLRITLRATTVAAATCVSLYAISALIVIAASPDIRGTATLDNMFRDTAFALLLVAGFVAAHAIIRSTASVLFNSWDPASDSDPEQRD